MERFYFHSTEAVWEMVAQEKWLGCRHAVAHVGPTRVNTSVGSMYFISGFSFHKAYMNYVFKTIYIYIV